MVNEINGTPVTSDNTMDIAKHLAALQQAITSAKTTLQQFSALVTPTPTTEQGTAVQNEPLPPPVSTENTNPVFNASAGPNLNSHDIERGRARSRSPSQQSEASYRNRPHSRNSFVTFNNDIPHFLLNEKPPQFDAKKNSPPQFLEKLQEYFDRHEIMQDRYRLACAKRSLQRYHEELVNRHNRKLKSYDDFEKMFLTEFWSTSDRLNFRENIFKEKFKTDSKSESLYKFYRRTLDHVEKYYPELSFEEFKLKFSAQIPNIAAIFVKNTNIPDFDALTTLMKSMDDCNSFEWGAAPRRERQRSERRRSPGRRAPNRDRRDERRDDQSEDRRDERQRYGNYKGRGDYRSRPYNKSRGNEQLVNMIHGFENGQNQ